MSLKGTPPSARAGTPFLSAGKSPSSTEIASGRQAAYGPDGLASEGLSPEGRKKLASGAAIKNWPANGPEGTTPQVFTLRGLLVGETTPAATARSQFSSSRSPRAALALIGRFR